MRHDWMLNAYTLENEVRHIMFKPQKVLKHQNGKIYFSKETERLFYFVLTIIMLLFGILSKAGIF